jgi:COP9 signalosome complex subunit 6
MLHDRILVLVSYVKDVLAGMSCFLSPPRHTYHIPIAGSTPKDHATIRSLVALVASLPASDSQGFRNEFETVPIPSSKPVSSLTDGL